MPLSDHERLLLEQMERALYEEDPKFASSLRGADVRSRQRRRIALAAVGFLIGLTLLLAGVIAQFWPISILGFINMLVAVTYVVSTMGRQATGVGPAARSGRAVRPAKKKSSFMDRAEERWRRRGEGGSD